MLQHDEVKILVFLVPLKQAGGADHPALFARSFLASQPHWIHSSPLSQDSDETFDCLFRFQHTKPLVSSRISQHPSGLLVTLALPHRAIAPGQYAVFYSEGECLGSAKIVRTLAPSLEETMRNFPRQ